MNVGLPAPVSAQRTPTLWRRLRHSLDALLLYFPVVLMGLLAMLTYWLVRNTPMPPEEAPRALPSRTHRCGTERSDARACA
jgi:lipopolysaccharide export system protein LptC